ncbi:MBL fold metallo-hydrolase [Streptomyces vinaceus]|uniref:MBL fold metallo-hydrolase n=1 Tax=Streptomyces vinaceus TaxID=1960 RepID=A0A5J6JDT4_STRVI|nr:MBL fold metallo-hydrolase [Streptomyces vinaceus]
MDTAIRIEVLPARLGDCLLVECARGSGPPWRMLVDGGPPSTWPRLEKRLSRLEPDERHIDVAVVTHIDSDHIGGMLPFLRSEYAEGVGDYWFNGPRTCPQSAGWRAASPRGRAWWRRCSGNPPVPYSRGTGRSAAVPSTPGTSSGSSRYRSRTGRTSPCSHRPTSAW